MFFDALVNKTIIEEWILMSTSTKLLHYNELKMYVLLWRHLELLDFKSTYIALIIALFSTFFLGDSANYFLGPWKCYKYIDNLHYLRSFYLHWQIFCLIFAKFFCWLKHQRTGVNFIICQFSGTYPIIYNHLWVLLFEYIL